MLNHLMRYADEAAAKADLPQYCKGGPWRADIVIAPQRVILRRAVVDNDGIVVVPEQVMPGFYLTISELERSSWLEGRPGGACRLIGNSDTGQLVYVAPDLDTALLATAIIEPLPFGVAYVFGA
ncbi:MAG: hypothetical protein ACM31O_01600 [Bacteroidota bacterium]